MKLERTGQVHSESCIQDPAPLGTNAGSTIGIESLSPHNQTHNLACHLLKTIKVFIILGYDVLICKLPTKGHRPGGKRYCAVLFDGDTLHSLE